MVASGGASSSETPRRPGSSSPAQGAGEREQGERVTAHSGHLATQSTLLAGRRDPRAVLGVTSVQAPWAEAPVQKVPDPPSWPGRNHN